MSSIYSQAPPTSGRVILQTTHGPLDIHLWSLQSPQTTRNFLQHCLNNYYTNLPFHRIMRNLLIQTGDPTQTGTGGVAAFPPYESGFMKENHSRLRFRHRGIVAMVADEAGMVRSQFFITLAPASWLDGLHSVIGIVKGESMFNLMRFGDKEVDGFGGDGGRVLGVEVVENPYKDISSRRVEKVEKDKGKGKVEKAISAKRAVRSGKLLSFWGGEGSDDESGDDDGGAYSFKKVERKGKGGGNRGNNLERKRGIVNTEQEKSIKEKMKDEGGGHVDGKRKDEDAIREANAEFERLKKQLMGDIGGNENAQKALVDVGQSSTRPEKKQFRKGVERVGNNRGNGDNTGGIGGVASGRVWKKKRKGNERETLRRLEKFERRLVESRRVAQTEGVGRSGAWFERGLKLGMTGKAAEEEYEIRIGGKRERGDRR